MEHARKQSLGLKTQGSSVSGTGPRAAGQKGEWATEFKRIFLLSLAEQALWAQPDEKSFDKSRPAFTPPFHPQWMSTESGPGPGWGLGRQSCPSSHVSCRTLWTIAFCGHNAIWLFPGKVSWSLLSTIISSEQLIRGLGEGIIIVIYLDWKSL